MKLHRQQFRPHYIYSQYSCNPFIQLPITLYQIEVAPVPIIDENINTNSYTEIKISKPYIALNDEIYMSLRHHELRSCKHIGNDFYCKELSIIKHKSKYSHIFLMFPMTSYETVVLLIIISITHLSSL